MRLRGRCVALIIAGAWAAGQIAFAQVPYQRLLRAESEPQNWLTYAGGYKSQRYSALDQINRKNVASLKLAWAYQMPRAGVVETSPLVVDGVMYLTEPPSSVTAVDVRSGRPLWGYMPDIPSDVIVIGSPPVNRGVAILDGTVFLGTVHGHLVALDARSGGVRWDVVVGDNKSGYYLTLAPLALDGKVIVGVSGAETGIRGFIDAYDAKTGKLAWRTYTVPAPGEPGSDTWSGDSWKTGGGSTWLTGSYDPDRTCSTGRPATRPPTGTPTTGVATTCTPIRCSRSTRPRAPSSGTFSSRPATITTGMPTRCSCSSTPPSADASGSSWRRPVATASTTCSIARPASS